MEIFSLCSRCNRIRPGATCDAFPAGIPDGIWVGLVTHDKPVDGDGGLFYEPRPTISEDSAANLVDNPHAARFIWSESIELKGGN